MFEGNKERDEEPPSQIDIRLAERRLLERIVADRIGDEYRKFHSLPDDEWRRIAAIKVINVIESWIEIGKVDSMHNRQSIPSEKKMKLMWVMNNE